MEKTLAKWSSQGISQGCKVCLRQGHFEYDDLSHRILTCPRSRNIIKHIQTTLTKQKVLTPVHILLTNTRCIHQIKVYSNGNNSPVKAHNPCVFLNKDKLHNMLALTFIWDCYIKYIMQCSNNDIDPSIDEAMKYVSREIVNFTKIMPVNPVCKELDQMFMNMNI